jgi:hypothetical protein
MREDTAATVVGNSLARYLNEHGIFPSTSMGESTYKLWLLHPSPFVLRIHNDGTGTIFVPGFYPNRNQNCSVDFHNPQSFEQVRDIIKGRNR